MLIITLHKDCSSPLYPWHNSKRLQSAPCQPPNPFYHWMPQYSRIIFTSPLAFYFQPTEYEKTLEPMSHFVFQHHLLTWPTLPKSIFSYSITHVSKTNSMDKVAKLLGRNRQADGCCCLVTQSCLTLLWCHGQWPTRLLCPWDFPDKNTGVCCHFLLQGIFPNQGSNSCFLHCRFFTGWTTRKVQQKGLSLYT